MQREYPDRPWVAVGAVVFRHGRVLLVKRRFEPRPDFWTLPGGMVEVGETTEEAVIREVQEECSITINPTRLVDIIDFIEADQDEKIRYHYIIVDFEAEYVSGSEAPASDVSELAWFAIDQLRDLKLPEITRDFFAKHYGLNVTSA